MDPTDLETYGTAHACWSCTAGHKEHAKRYFMDVDAGNNIDVPRYVFFCDDCAATVKQNFSIELAPIVWTEFTARCESCRREFRIGTEALEQTLETDRHFDKTTTPADSANGFQFCLECSGGETAHGEIV